MARCCTCFSRPHQPRKDSRRAAAGQTVKYAGQSGIYPCTSVMQWKFACTLPPVSVTRGHPVPVAVGAAAAATLAHVVAAASSPAASISTSSWNYIICKNYHSDVRGNRRRRPGDATGIVGACNP